MARRRDPTKPALPTIKRLFAHSGNQCAFPRCPATLFDGSTVVGKVCHIKGAKPGSARYDAQQSAAGRHGFDNLILMCGWHHDVIDDDEESYTVERLIKMKTDHESRAAAVDDDVAETAARFLIDQSVMTINQSGGIAAHTIHTINVHPPSALDNETEEKTTLLTQSTLLDYTILLSCQWTRFSEIAPKNGSYQLPIYFGPGVGSMFGPYRQPGSKMFDSADVDEPSYICKFVNFGNSPVVNVEADLTLNFRDIVKTETGWISSRNIIKTYIIKTPRANLGVGQYNEFEFYVRNWSEYYAEIMLPSTVRCQAVGSDQWQTAVLIRPQLGGFGLPPSKSTPLK